MYLRLYHFAHWYCRSPPELAITSLRDLLTLHHPSTGVDKVLCTAGRMSAKIFRRARRGLASGIHVISKSFCRKWNEGSTVWLGIIILVFFPPHLATPLWPPRHGPPPASLRCVRVHHRPGERPGRCLRFLHTQLRWWFCKVLFLCSGRHVF